jgi:hypothetical protein
MVAEAAERSIYLYKSSGLFRIEEARMIASFVNVGW